MQHPAFKSLIKKLKKSLLTTGALLSLSAQRAYALSCSTYVTDDDPHILGLVCIAARIVNVLLLSSGAVLIIMIIYSSYKFAMSQGDPKGLQGAKETLYLALYGFFAIVFLLAGLNIMGGLFGFPGGVFGQGLFTNLYNAIERLIDVSTW
jgi:hypothetical protein